MIPNNNTGLLERYIVQRESEDERAWTHIEGDDDAGRVIGRQLDGGAEEPMVVKVV